MELRHELVTGGGTRRWNPGGTATVTAVAFWFRLEARRRGRWLVVLAVLVGLAAGTVMTAVAGARRGASAVDRLQARTLPATLAVLPGQPGFDWHAVRALPEVEAVSTVVIAPLEFEGQPPASVIGGDLVVPGDDQLLSTLERPVVLEGRLPDRTRPDEVVVSPRFVQSRGKGVGDSVSVRLLSPQQLDAYFAEAVVPETVRGPAVEATIVGVVRSTGISEETMDGPGFAVASAGLFATYAPNLIGDDERGFLNAYVRLKDGHRAIPRFQAGLAEISGRTDIAVFDLTTAARHRRDVTGFEADSLLVFALAALIAAAFLVGQALARYAATTVTDLQVLQAVGMTPVQSRAAALLGPTLAASAGATLGAGGAVVASRWFPIGNASLSEPTPGLDVDAPVLVAGLLVVPLLVAVGTVVATSLALRSTATAPWARPSSIAMTVARLGLPAPAVVGTRLALESGRGRQAVPVRPVLIGAVTGVAGVLAALTFSRAIEEAASNPARFGQTHQLEAFLGFDDVDFGPVIDMLGRVAQHPDVAGVNDTRNAAAQAGHVSVDVFSLDPVGRPLEVVLTSGRLPYRSDEITVAPRTAEALAVGIGDTVELTGGVRSEDLVVTGLAFVPVGFHNDYATGAWVTGETYDTLFAGFKVRAGLVALRPGVEAQAVAPLLQEAVGGDVEFTPPSPPAEATELRQVRVLPLVLAGFLAMQALGGVAHALAATARRRRRDVAVLKVLGMTGRQCRGVIATQAVVLGLVGVIFGAPLGVALGRTVWRVVAEATPVSYASPATWSALVLAVPVSLLAANLLAVWPSQRAARMRPADALRAE